MLRIGMVAGESSGDYLGAGLINAIKCRNNDLHVEGIGGEKMLAAGINNLFSMEKLSVIGITEILGCYRELSAIRNRLREYFIENPPDVFIGIDAPDFNLWLEKELRKTGIKTIHYVSPSVWAWREYRIRKIRDSVDLILNLFPFESEYYERHEINNQFVGHPLADELTDKNNSKEARKALRIEKHKRVIAILPGSRINEIDKISPALLMAARKAKKNNKDLCFVSSLVNQRTYKKFVDMKEALVPDLPIDIHLGKTHQVIEASDVVLLASGTVALEAMLLGKPMVIAYRLSFFTYLILKAFAKIPYVSLPNILAEKKIVPECLQTNCVPEKIYVELQTLLDDSEQVKQVCTEFSTLSNQLRTNAHETAANAVLQLIDGK